MVQLIFFKLNKKNRLSIIKNKIIFFFKLKKNNSLDVVASNLRSRSWTQLSSVYFFIYKSTANLNMLKNQNQKRLKSNTITWTRGLAPWARERKSLYVWAFKVRLACLTCNSFFLFKGRLHFFFKKKEDDKSLVVANNVSFANLKSDYYCGSWKIKPISFL